MQQIETKNNSRCLAISWIPSINMIGSDCYFCRGHPTTVLLYLVKVKKAASVLKYVVQYVVCVPKSSIPKKLRFFFPPFFFGGGGGRGGLAITQK